MGVVVVGVVVVVVVVVVVGLVGVVVVAVRQTGKAEGVLTVEQQPPP